MELFYRRDDAMMTVDVSTEASFAPGTPRLLFRGSYWKHPFEDVVSYHVSPDGEHFLMIEEEEPPEPPQIHVIINWVDEMERRLSSRSD